MPLPPVVIELPPKDVASEHAPALVTACSDAVEDGDCQLGERAGETPRALAIVAWSESRLKCRIELGLRRGDETRWGTRELEFDAGDPMVERFRTVGLVIGTLVGRAEREAAAENAAAGPAEAPSTKPPASEAQGNSAAARERKPPGAAPADGRGDTASAPRDADGDSRSRFRAALAAVAGPALNDGTWRFGGELEFGARPFARVPVRALFAARHRVRPTDANDVTVTFTSLRLGVSWQQRLSEDFSAEFGGGASYERIAARVEAAPQDSGGRDALGSWATVLVAVQVARGVEVAAGLGVSVTTPTDILLSGRIVGRAQRVSAEGQIGPRLSF